MGRLPAFLIAAVSAAILATPARADRIPYEDPPPPPPPRDDFWRDVVSPNADEIADILAKVAQATQYAHNALYQDLDRAAEQRARLLDEAYGMLRYARRLDPGQAEVLKRLGEVAEESGRPLAAVEAFQAYLADLDPDAAAPPDVHARLGRAYMRLDRWDDAIRHLRAALGDGVAAAGYTAYHHGYNYYSLPAPAPAVYLGVALMETGRLPDAIDVLQRYTAPNPYGLTPEQIQAQFALAVAYDRDEQITAAFGVLDALATQLTGGYGYGYGGPGGFASYVHQQLTPIAFVPAHDRAYFLALLYESAGYLSEARTSWLVYAQAEDAPYRRRALAHVAAIDQLLEERLRAAAKAAKQPKPPTGATPATGAPPRRPPVRHPPRRP